MTPFEWVLFGFFPGFILGMGYVLFLLNSALGKRRK